MVTQDKILIRGELALIFAVFIDAFGVVLMLYSGAGISAISSLPFAGFDAGYSDIFISGTADF